MYDSGIPVKDGWIFSYNGDQFFGSTTYSNGAR